MLICLLHHQQLSIKTFKVLSDRSHSATTCSELLQLTRGLRVEPTHSHWLALRFVFHRQWFLVGFLQRHKAFLVVEYCLHFALKLFDLVHFWIELRLFLFSRRLLLGFNLLSKSLFLLLPLLFQLFSRRTIGDLDCESVISVVAVIAYSTVGWFFL